MRSSTNPLLALVRRVVDLARQLRGYPDEQQTLIRDLADEVLSASGDAPARKRRGRPPKTAGKRGPGRPPKVKPHGRDVANFSSPKTADRARADKAKALLATIRTRPSAAPKSAADSEED